MKKIISFSVLLLFFLCLTGYAGEKKILVALIDFIDETPNKMAITPGENAEPSNVYLSEVMQIIRELTEKSDMFEILPQKAITEAMKTEIGKEAAARRYDRFSSARLGKMLGVDAILTGKIVQFEKNIIPRDFTINGLSFQKSEGDVVIRVRLINAYNGMEIADITGTGIADENVLETVSAAVVHKLSIGFIQATKISAMKILRELASSDIKTDKEYIPAPPSIVDMMNFTVVQAEGQYIYINAGLNRNISVADLFTILKKDEAGNLTPVAIYSVSSIEHNSSKLVLIEPMEALGTILVGDKAQRKIR